MPLASVEDRYEIGFLALYILIVWGAYLVDVTVSSLDSWEKCLSGLDTTNDCTSLQLWVSLWI